MTELLSNLADSCHELQILRVNDNWLKDKATDMLLRLIIRAKNTLTELNISDCNMGGENVHGAVTALKQAGLTLKSFSCNYNECDNQELFQEVLEMLKLVISKEEDAVCYFIGNREIGGKNAIKSV